MEKMATKKLSEWQIKLLYAPLPKEAVKPHPTKTYLSSIKAIYVVERLNEVFGVGQWRLTSQVISNTGKMIVVQSWLKIPEYGIELESYGGNDNADLGDAYKGATTDALTKMASMIGIGMDVFKGLGNGSQENNNHATPAATPPAPQPAATPGKKPLQVNTPAYTKAVDFIATGGSWAQIKKTYYVSPEIEAAINEEARTAA